METAICDFLAAHTDLYRVISTSSLVFSDEFLPYCEKNCCGKYNSNWMCPPAFDGITKRAQYLEYPKVAVFVKTKKLPDPFDWETMESLRKETTEVLIMLKKFLCGKDYQMLGPGACSLCSACSYPEAICRLPDFAIPSAEAIGLDVKKAADAAGIPYYYGANTVVYFAFLFF